MTIRFIKFGLCFMVLTVAYVYAEAVYTWTDETGIIHISKNRPPENARQSDQIAYTPNPPAEGKDIQTSQMEKHKESIWLNALQLAKQERKNADAAREIAENAIQAANRLKRETDEYLKPWRNRNRIKRDMLSQIDRRIQTTNELIDRAEALIQKANEAEQTARSAELEANRIQQELFEQYNKIMSN